MVLRHANHVGTDERRHHLDGRESVMAETWSVKGLRRKLKCRSKNTDFCQTLGVSQAGSVLIYTPGKQENKQVTAIWGM
jgi:hypothetical protein